MKTPITINGKRHCLDNPKASGRHLKQVACVALGDTLFLNVPGGDDAVVHNDVTICLTKGACLYSCPPARYGEQVSADVIDVAGHEGDVDVRVQPNGWRFLILGNYTLPSLYRPRRVRLCVKLPPQFPDAQPDMFWVNPKVTLANGTSPQSTSIETLLGEPWMRFSWHLEPGVWRPGASTLADFLACVRARFHKGN